MNVEDLIDELGTHKANDVEKINCDLKRGVCKVYFRGGYDKRFPLDVKMDSLTISLSDRQICGIGRHMDGESFIHCY